MFPVGEAQTFTPGGDLAGDWWTLFHSKTLDDLIAQALANNPDLKAAQAALRVAHENTAAQRGATIIRACRPDSPPSAFHSPATLAPVPSNNAFDYNLYTPQLSVSYVPDVFGLNRRTVESLQAQERGARYQMIATYTTLTSNVVVAAIQDGRCDAQIAATQRDGRRETKSVDILRLSVQKGYVSGVDVAAQESQLAQAKAALPPLIKQAAQLHDQLAVLCGQFPERGAGCRNSIWRACNCRRTCRVSLPSKLVAQRPDVLQAQEICTPPARRSAWPKQTVCPISNLTGQRRKHGAGDRPAIQVRHRLLERRRGTGRSRFSKAAR